MKRYHPGQETLVMTQAQVREFDAWAIDTAGIPGVVLMENAGRSCAELILRKLSDIDHPKVCVFCGTGNNGGDGYVIARHIENAHFNVTVVICGNSEKIKGDAKTNLDIIEHMGVSIERLHHGSDVPAMVKRLTEGYDMLVDALFGTGLKGRLRPEYIELIESINAQNLPILAVDIPSGMDCDTGQSLGAVIRADITVTFVAVKKGFTLDRQAAHYAGEIFIASIGVEPSARAIG